MGVFQFNGTVEIARVLHGHMDFDANDFIESETRAFETPAFA
jgi:hypothetical protein